MGFSDELRMRVKHRANFTCCWCREPKNKVEIHHIKPEAEGGPDTEDNAAPLCSGCHTLYGDNPKLRKEIIGRRDNWYKLCEKDYVLVSLSDIRANLQHISTQSPDIAAKPQANWPREDTDWELIYELSLPAQPIEPAGSQSLVGWRFAFGSPDPRIALYSGAALGIGNINNSVAGRSPVPRVHNCRVDCDVRILEYGTEPSNWAGLRVRGIYDDLTLGYLAFLRADGRFDIHRVDEIIHTVKAIETPQQDWTNVRVDIVDNKITVRINGSQIISVTDQWFGGLGHVYIHTFGTHSLFRNFRVYTLRNEST